jgi:hypothetical protein
MQFGSGRYRPPWQPAIISSRLTAWMKKMNRIACVSRPLTRIMALLTIALAAGCGGGGGGGGDTGPAPMPGNSIAPTVSGTINANGASNVAINTKVGATFSEAMDPSTIGPASFFLMQGTTVVPCTVSYTGLSAILAPASNLAPGTRYTVTVKGGAGGVKDLTGMSMTGDYVWSWTTGTAADTTAPRVVGTINANGATNIAVNSRIGATFSEGMDPLTINTATFLLTQGTTPVPGTVSYSGVNAVLVPAANLAAGTRYTVTIKGGAGGVKDLPGNLMAGDYVLSWTTGAAADTTAPTVTGTINPNGASNVALNTKVGAIFSEGMDPLTISTKTLTLMQGSTPVVGTVSYSGLSAVFAPSSNLAPTTTYTVTVKGGVSGVKDLAGNFLASDYVWGWSTGASNDSGPPMVLATTIANGATNVPVNPILVAIFSEAMDPLTITNVNCTLLETLTGATVTTGTVFYSGVSAEFRQDGFGPHPVFLLLPNTGYTITIRGGANGVEDLAGNPMTGDFVWTFTTGTTIL